MAASDPHTHPDSLLQASRRLDWRFLLPDPNLGRVAYIGRERGVLLEALKLFSAALTVIERSPPHDLRPTQFDLVVAKQPAPIGLVVAAALIRPAGFLYLEAYGLVGFRWSRRDDRLWLVANHTHLLHPNDYAITLRQLGFVLVDVHWHWPNFESCLEIVPLHSQAAVQHALARRRSNVAARLKTAFGHWLLRNGWFPRVIPCFSIVAQMRP